MTAEEYVKQRLDDQINWYDAKSQWNQKSFKVLRITEVVAAATIPFLVGYQTDAQTELRVLTGILGVLVAVIAGILSILKVQENWIEYRATCESLKHEKFIFLTKAAPYDSSDSFSLLVSRVEGLISKENTNWAQYTTLAGKKEAASD